MRRPGSVASTASPMTAPVALRDARWRRAGGGERRSPSGILRATSGGPWSRVRCGTCTRERHPTGDLCWPSVPGDRRRCTYACGRSGATRAQGAPRVSRKSRGEPPVAPVRPLPRDRSRRVPSAVGRRRGGRARTRRSAPSARCASRASSTRSPRVSRTACGAGTPNASGAVSSASGAAPPEPGLSATGVRPSLAEGLRYPPRA